MAIDNVLFEAYGGFVLDVDVTNTGSADGILYDQIMVWLQLVGGGSGEVSFVF